MTAAIHLFASEPMTSELMTSALMTSATETGRDLPADPWVFGLGAFVLLVVMLLITLSFGKDR